MAPLSTGISTHYAFTRTDETAVYRAGIDVEWTIGEVPHGGYMAALVLDALSRHQERAGRHPDAAHLTIQFLFASTVAPCEIHITRASLSKRWTRLDVALYQEGSKAPRLRAHALYTDLPELGPPARPSKTNVTVLPNSISEFAQVCPLQIHPADCSIISTPPAFNFRNRIAWSTPATDVIVKDLSWGGWIELNDREEDVRRSAVLMGFFGDLFRNGLEKLPKDEQPSSSWLPTLTFAVDFKCKFPIDDEAMAPRTVGSFAKTDFLHAGRYGSRVEVWSAPSAIGVGRVGKGDEWRKESRILAVASQMALLVPYAVNARKAGAKL